MNSVERIVYYACDIEQEPPHEILEVKPAAPWPSEGKLEIKDAFSSIALSFRLSLRA